ncbi:MAG: tetratricopeptide repeat protein [Polyangia bacterium]
MAKKRAQEAPPVRVPFLKRHLPLAILLAASALFYVGAGVLSGQLNLADDYGYIVQFGHYDRPLNFAGLVQMFNGISRQEMLHDYYRPIYTLIRSIDYRLYGTSPTGYHLTSLLFYLLAVACAHWILRRLLFSELASFLGALLFALHPIHVEAVAWIMAGGYAMAGAFALLSFALYLSGRTWASTLAFAAAGLTNPPAVVMPALVWGHMSLFHAKEAAEGRRRAVNLTMISAAAAGIVFLNFVVFPQRYSGTTFDSTVAARSWLANLFAYMRLMVVPLGLHTPYEGYVERWSDPRCLAGAAALLLIGAAVLLLRRRNRLAAFGVFWFFVGLLPTLTIWRKAAGMADRYVFLASFGFILVPIALLAGRSDGGLWPNGLRDKVRKALAALAIVFVAFFAALAWQRVRAWRDTETLFIDTLRTDPGNIFAVRTLARYYSVTVSTPEKAVPYLDRSMQLAEGRIGRVTNPSVVHYEQYNLAELRSALGIVRRELGQYDEAVALHESAIAGISNTELDGYRAADYFFQMGLAYDKMADLRKKTDDQPGFVAALEKALSCYQKSIERLPILSHAYQNAGFALFRLGRLPEAERTLEKALQLTPNNVEVIGLLANSYTKTGDQAKAKALLDEAIQKAGRRQGNSPLMRELQRLEATLAGTPTASQGPAASLFALLGQKKYEEALRVALSLQEEQGMPDPLLLNNIGLCYYKLARYPEAERAYLEAVKLRPDYDTAMGNLSLVYAKQDRLDLAISYAKRALKLNPDDSSLRRHLEDYYRRRSGGRGDAQ